ncbi:hypothetical protein [Xenorhabdus bovienii]|uniref:hypothetical protein n=1 Tax=Xenorhabdus bovienii TaxID=40576 RepID=UPI0023B23DE5|nr:hypothetical protein [Xenorhabdus bovienii]MDE9459737.1 hypothetical protein [Xenorhabdus bovienii]MDE9488156.1 hypothetical protein [Xenorhabdus bovienii]MDE9516069.1 hypothetical protein [Xenorhabdus bovienii]
MDKEQLLIKIVKAIDLLEEEKRNNKNQLQSIINLFIKTKEKIINNSLKYNDIRSSARMYVEMYNDYMNPILNYLDEVGKDVDDYLRK